MKNTITRILASLAFFGLAGFGWNVSAQTFLGTNAPGTNQDFSFTTGPGATNLSILINNSATAFSHLLLKAGATPSDTNFDFLAAINGPTNAIVLEAPELKSTNYTVRVRTPLASLSHAFTLTILTNLTTLRTTQAVTKPLISTNTGVIGNGAWNFFRVEIPTNVAGWRVILTCTNTGPDLYIQRDNLPNTTSWLKRSQSQTNDVIAFTSTEAAPGAFYIGVFQPVANTNGYTLRTELITFTTLNWDPGTTDAGTQVYTANTNGGDYYFKITTQNTAVNAWRSRLSVITGEANLYLSKGTPASVASNMFKSERVGSDGFVLGSSTFSAGEDWYYLVHADPGSQWTLVTGEAFVTDLGTVATNGASGSGNVTMGPEGMRFFKTSMPGDIIAWRLWLSGLTNSVLVAKTFAPIPGSSDLSQSGQMLVVPPYLVGGAQYFVGVAGVPGITINLDSRQQPFTDIPFTASTNLNISGFDYAVFRVQVPADEIAWQVSVVVTNGNPNVAVRRNLVPNENNNDAYSEVPGTVTDSILLVPPTLSDGTFFITVYGTNSFTCNLQSGAPEITDINFTSTTVNNDPNRVGWRLFKITDIDQQLGALGWDLFLTNFTAGTKIALRRNAAPGIWNFRNPFPNTAGIYDFISTAEFLQRPGHQADIWYVGVYNPSNALGNFTLITRELTADPIVFDGGSSVRTSVPAGKWQFFRVDVPTATGLVGWDVRVSNVSTGLPQVVVRREALPVSLVNIGFSGAVIATNWATGNQWVAANDWTTRTLSSDGTVNETGRILTFGFGRPIDPGTYYIGVISPPTSTNVMSYTLLSRGIGPSNTIPVQPINYVENITNPSLPARDLAVYSITIPTNTANWKLKLAANTGDALMAVAKDRMPNISAPHDGLVTNIFTAGKKMTKFGNEHFVELPVSNSMIFAGTYYIVVVSEGTVDPTKPTWIGSGSANYTLQSLGQMPETNLGLLDTNDLTFTGALEGGEAAAFHFENYTWPVTLGFELSLENKTGNPAMVTRGTLALADPGAATVGGGGVQLNPYGNDGGDANFLQAGNGFITVADPSDFETVMLKARDTNSLYPDATYTLRIRKLVPHPVTFDGGTNVIVGQTNNYEFFEFDVPPNALGWDVRVTNVTGTVKMIICRDFLALDVLTSAWNPATAKIWPSGANWQAFRDWSMRFQSPDGTVNEEGRMLAMGMGVPLEPGRYYVGVKNLNTSIPASYTVVSRGIGPGLKIPVVDLAFNGGIATNLAVSPREAAYYQVVIPPGTASWQTKMTALSGEALLLVLTNNVPSVLSGRSPAGGTLMQKTGNEHFLVLPPNGQSTLVPGTNFILVASEGWVSNGFPTRIGSSNSSFIIESRGQLLPFDLGTISDIQVNQPGALEGGEIRAYQFTVPAGTKSFEARLLSPTGNPAMVLRVGSLYPEPGAGSPTFGSGSVNPDTYGSVGGQLITSVTGDANTNLITVANPTPGLYTIMVKARSSVATVYTNATYTLGVKTVSFIPIGFDGSATAVTNQPSANWQYFRVDVPTNALGWDIRLTNIVSGTPRLVVRRDLLPFALTTTPWSSPGNQTNWPTTNQWAASADWTRRQFSPDGVTNEDGRILQMGMAQPLEPGTYYIGVLGSGGTNAMNYTLLSRGIGDSMSIPVIDLAFNGGSTTNNNLLAREAAYYRVTIPSNTPSWKMKLAPTSGEVMLVVMTNKVPNIDTGHSIAGKFMQKAGNEHYVLLPAAGQTNGITAGVYYIAVVSEGLNPSSSTRIGSGGSSYVLTSFGISTVTNLGTISLSDIVSSETLEGGESRLYQFTIPVGAMAVELRLQNRVGNPFLSLVNTNWMPDPGGAVTGSKDFYGNDGGFNSSDAHPEIITVVNPLPGVYSLAIKARAVGTPYPDASYTLRVRQLPMPELNFTSEFNTNGFSNVGSGLLADAQRAYYKVIVPSNVQGKPVLGWQLDVSQLTGVAAIRVRKDILPSESFGSGMPLALSAAVIAPPYLTNGTWYVEVKATNSTTYTLVSSTLVIQRPAWSMPGVGEPTTTPGLTAPLFADTGVDTNGVALPGDQGIDLEQGKYHYYALTAPTNNGGLIRMQLDAISGNADLYVRTNQVPTGSHSSIGSTGTTLDRSLTGSVTEYANWIPVNGRNEVRLMPGTWYVAVRAVTGANARYRLRISTGNVQPLDFYSGSVTNQVLAGGDWRYYKIQLPIDMPANWSLTFSQQSGDAVMYLRDTIPPGAGATTGVSDIKDWATDLKNNGPYPNYDFNGTYPLTVPPVRPGSIYYVGIRAKTDTTFALSSLTSGPTNTALPIIAFYGGSVTNTIPVGGMVAYRIITPADGIRWRHTSVHSNSVQVYIEGGTMPVRSFSDDFISATPNSSQDRFLILYPWLPEITYYMVVTNTSAFSQFFSFTMNGSSNTADDDGDGMLDAWELSYFGSLGQLPNGDADLDGVINLHEFQEGTDPNDRGSFRPRLFILSTNGVVNVNPPGTNFLMGTNVTLTATPNAGFSFLGWNGSTNGTANPLLLVMNTNKTLIPRFRVPADDFDQRITLAGFAVSYSGLSNSGASKEPGEPNHAGNTGGRSLWWTWQAPASGTVNVTTEGSTFRNALALYIGSTVSNLSLVASNLAGIGTNTSQVAFPATAGNTYVIAVDGFNGATGSIVVNITIPGSILLNNPALNPNRTFHFTVLSSAGSILRIDASTNLLQWVPLVTITNSTGSMDIVDPNSTNYPRRFYRGVVP